MDSSELQRRKVAKPILTLALGTSLMAAYWFVNVKVPNDRLTYSRMQNERVIRIFTAWHLMKMNILPSDLSKLDAFIVEEEANRGGIPYSLARNLRNLYNSGEFEVKWTVHNGATYFTVKDRGAVETYAWN